VIPLPLSLALKSALLFAEAQQVIWLRMIRLAAGGAPAERELRRMLFEKLQASADLAMTFAAAMAVGKPMSTGADRAVRSLRARVKKNRRRLA